MSDLNVSTLPKEVQEWVKSRLAKGRFQSLRDYFVHLVERERSEEKLDLLLLEGLHSGDPIDVNDAFWAELRKDADALIAKHKKRA
jgi:antitoxin ParD1/3/4